MVLGSIQEQVIQSIAGAVWNRPEVSRIREPVQKALEGNAFKKLVSDALDQLEAHTQVQLPNFMSAEFVLQDRTLRQLNAYVVQRDASAIDALASDYVKQFNADLGVVRPVVDRFMLEFREALATHPQYGPILLARDMETMLEALLDLKTTVQRGFTSIDARFDEVLSLLRVIFADDARLETINSKTDPHIFISYARKDGKDSSQRLYQALLADGFTAWRDQRIDPTQDFTAEIETAINNAWLVVVIVTPDIKRDDSFVRLEIGYALTQKKRILPLMFPGGHRPITIINHTYIDFTDWNSGYVALVQRLKNPQPEATTAETRRENEFAYLQSVGQKYDHWRNLYTDMSATARVEERKVKLKSAVAHRYMQMRHNIHKDIDHSLDSEKGKTVTVENFAELRDGIRQYKRVALIGDPGAGKTTTLERLAYELAEDATENDDGPLPVFVRMGAYTGDDFTQFTESFFGGLSLTPYLPLRIILLLDGLNEMPSEHLGKVTQWIEQNPDVSMIVSCRKLDYVNLKLPLQRIDVAPLDLDRIRLFMSNYLEDEDVDTLFWGLAGYRTREAWIWYKQNNNEADWRALWYEQDTLGNGWEPERKILDELRQNLRERQHLPDMLDTVTNPFLLQIVIEVYFTEGEPPRNKGDLFGHFVTMLFEERGKVAEKPDRVWINEVIQKQALSALAYRMQDQRTGTSVPADWVRLVFSEAVPGIDPETLLYFAASASILEYGTTVRFTHQLLQEYFAATGMGADINVASAKKYFPSDQWWEPTGWEETAVLLAGIKGDATPVVEWLTPVQPDLAYRVAIESGVDCSETALERLFIPSEGARSSPYARAEWGRRISDSDTRKGVGLRDGLPDIDWVEIPAGEFIYQQDEKLTLPTFFIARYPVTYIQFQTFLDAEDGFKYPQWWQDMGHYQMQEMQNQNNPYANHPRDRISWYQAVAFARWLDSRLSKPDPTMHIRLPLETEWEKVARGTDGREYPWGDGYRVGHANCDEQEDGNGPYFLNQTTAVGLYPVGQSPYGVCDMAGTVWEWCLNKYETPIDTLLDTSNDHRVLRGGSFRSLAKLLRTANRSYGSPYGRYFDGVFRLCLVFCPPSE
ncbi:MAG: SUMF1/EgtB/PvdO family nonheme iron enzyme [Aggregatilineales bacterium]